MYKKMKLEGLTFNVYEEFINFLDEYVKMYYINDKSNYSHVYILLHELGVMFINKKDFRVIWEFNPTKINLNLDIFYKFYDKFNYFINFKKNDIFFNRLDFAFDLINFDINLYSFNSLNKKKKVIFYNKNFVETIYLGSRKSWVMFRVYDKIKELKRLGYITHEYYKYDAVTRLEIEIKKEISYDIDLNFINEILQDIIIIKNDNFFIEQFLKKYDVKTAVFLFYVLKTDNIKLLNNLDCRTKKKYLSIIDKYKIEFNKVNLNIELKEVIKNINDFRKSLDVRKLLKLPF